MKLNNLSKFVKIPNIKDKNINSQLKLKNVENDTFELINKVKNMTENNNENFIKDLQEINQKSNFKYSPVDFVISDLLDFAENKINLQEFFETISNKTKQAQFIFSRMSASDITENQKLFKKEFDFADKLNKLILSKTPEENFKNACKKIIDEYKN